MKAWASPLEHFYELAEHFVSFANRNALPKHIPNDEK